MEDFNVTSFCHSVFFKRVWAADVDKIYQLFTGSDAGPVRKMDMVGLDVVLDIENHYAGIRPGIPEAPRTLLKSYLEKGWTSRKAGRDSMTTIKNKKNLEKETER